MVIAIDFDGTCVTHEFPSVGKDVGAVPVLKKLVKGGHSLILYTMRSDKLEVNSKDKTIHPTAGKHLTDAVEWFKKNNIPLYGINSNPTQSSWTSSPKAYAQLYIDDAALGCPLIDAPEYSERPFVDWEEIESMLKKRGII